MIIRRTAEILVAALTPEELFPRVCELLASQFGAHFVAIGQVVGTTTRVRWSFAAEDSGIETLDDIPASEIDVERTSIRHLEHDRIVLFVPLRCGSDDFGYLALGGGMKRFSSGDIGLIETCARYLAVSIANVVLAREKERLEALATHDGLTGVYNRRAFDERLAYEWKRSLRSHEPISLVMMDVDYFKVYNDAYGHVSGDHCLQQIAQALNGSTARGVDFVARYGGEEFVAILPNTPELGAIGVAERMNRAVADLKIAHRGTDLDRVSISAGVATIVPSAPGGHAGLIEAADASLYSAKENGRNRVAALGFVGVAPPVRRRFEGRNNLPAQPTSFVGRERELASIARSLPTAPVVSLLGPGGVGKTRLAIAAAHTAMATFPGGVWLVELGAERSGSRVADLVAAALSTPGINPFDELVETMTRNPALLVLDSCEHLLEACAELVTQLVRRCPDARIVTTSRQPLGLPGELRLRIEPFRLEDAVQLFIHRAQDVRPGISFDENDIALAARICRRIDGLPLGIELAAMRLQSLNLLQLAEHGSTLPHQTALYDRIASSFQLLDDQERRFLARLSILAGPFDEDAARAIGGGQTFDALESFELLTRLVDKSLVQVDLESGHYRLLAAIAEYVRPRLAEFDSAAEIRAQAARHYAAVLSEMHASLRANARPETFERYGLVMENVETVMDWSLDGDDVETGAAIAADMAPYWLETGRLADARRYLDLAISRAEDLSRRRIVDVLEAAVNVAVARGDAQSVEELAQRLRNETGSTTNRAEAARVEFATALALTLTGKHDEAAGAYLEALSGFRAAGETRSIARTLVAVAGIAIERDGDQLRARSLLAEALELARLTGPPSLSLDVVGRLADLIAQTASDAEAASLIRDVGAHFAEVGDDASLAWTIFLLARHELGIDPIVARMHARDALERLRGNAHPGRLASCFEFLARLYAIDREDETAVRLLAFAAGLRRAHGMAASPIELRERNEVYEELQGRIESEHFDRIVREGRTMDLDSAIRRALSGDHLPVVELAPA